MKVHQLASVELWEQEPSLSKRLRRPLAPNLGHSFTVSIIDLKSFIKPQNDAVTKNSTPKSEVQSGGTRWNPTQEQIDMLERLYRGGMRTPNAQQIEQITLQLGKYGKIEGKNVFYWFQNHKARERQRQKRVGLSTTRPVAPLSNNIGAEGREAEESSVQSFTWDDSGYKRRCRPWVVQSLEDEKEEHQTLELFPLKPERAN